MNKTLLALTLILATAFADLADLNLGSLGTGISLTNAGLYTSGTTTLGLIVNGDAASAAMGTHVSDAGDFNWDGYPDYIITGALANAFVVLGMTSARTASLDLGAVTATLQANYIVQITITGATNLVVAGVGDVTRDGFDDVVVAWPGGLSGAGCAWVVFGRTGRGALTYAPGVGNQITGEDLDLANNKGYFYIFRTGGAATDALGTAVSAAGDLDGDGFDDFLISMPGAASAVGTVYVVRGKQFVSTATPASLNVRIGPVDVDKIDNPPGTPIYEGFYITGELNTKQIGRYVAYAGDFNGDTCDDVIIGGLDYAYIVYGVKRGATTPFASLALVNAPAVALVTIIKGAASESFGKNVGLAGDLNDDGVADVFVGSPTASVVSGGTTNTAAGKVYIIWGSKVNSIVSLIDCTSATTLTTKGIILSGGATNDAFGTNSDGVGDVNLDGIDDIVIGAPTTGTSAPGKAYVVYGSKTLASMTITSLSAGTNGITITGKTNGDKFGTAVSRVGNINADTSNVDDFIVGAPGATSTSGGNAKTGGGIVYEFYGIKKTVVTTTTPTGSGFRLEASLLVLASFFVALIF